MHAADAAGGKNGDARHVGDHHRRGDGGRTVHAARADDRQVAARDLGDAAPGLAEVGDLLLGQTRLQAAAEDSDGGGHCAVVAQSLLNEQRRLHIFRIGHAVRDDRALERDDRAAVRKRLLHLGCDVQIFVQIHIKNLLVDSSDRFALYCKRFSGIVKHKHAAQPAQTAQKGDRRSGLLIDIAHKGPVRPPSASVPASEPASRARPAGWALPP